jgi:hypothetical protein
MTPPTEPGWYWIQRADCAVPQVVYVRVMRGGKLGCIAFGWPFPVHLSNQPKTGKLYGARWRPGRIEP